VAKDPGSLWSNLPAILTAIGGALTALATLVGALYSAGLVGRKKKNAAASSEAPAPTVPAASTAESPPPPLRRTPGLLTVEQVKALFVRQGIYDARWNASASGSEPRYATQLAGDAILVVDGEHGLTWQRSGSPNPLTFAGAEAYLDALNDEDFAGVSDWRLPTLEEAGTLLAPALHAGFHLDPVFEKGINFIWTCDRHPDGGIWMVYFADGQVACERPDFHAWVRAVR
jgi:hypothetical protein